MPVTTARKIMSKRLTNARKLVEVTKSYPLGEAISVLSSLPKAKFDETVEIAFNLGVDPRQSDQMVRGTVALPNGSGKKVIVAVFSREGEAADAAKAAGAEHVGFEELLEKCKGGWTDFDVAIATPEAMLEVRKLGKVLGPRGLMPNPKTGTVTEDTAKAVREVKAGRVEFKLDKTGNLHVAVGKRSFDNAKLEENIRAVVEAVVKAKPSSSKGKYLKNVSLTATMSPGMKVDTKEFLATV